MSEWEKASSGRQQQIQLPAKSHMIHVGPSGVRKTQLPPFSLILLLTLITTTTYYSFHSEKTTY